MFKATIFPANVCTLAKSFVEHQIQIWTVNENHCRVRNFCSFPHPLFCPPHSLSRCPPPTSILIILSFYDLSSFSILAFLSYPPLPTTFSYKTTPKISSLLKPNNNLSFCDFSLTFRWHLPRCSILKILFFQLRVPYERSFPFYGWSFRKKPLMV